jgi:hypothetical protein
MHKGSCNVLIVPHVDRSIVMGAVQSRLVSGAYSGDDAYDSEGDEGAVVEDFVCHEEALGEGGEESSLLSSTLPVHLCDLGSNPALDDETRRAFTSAGLPVPTLAILRQLHADDQRASEEEAE